MRTLLFTCIAVVCTLLTPTRAHAQSLVLSDPAIDADERDCIVMTLALDDDQTAALDELLAVYTSEAAELSASFADMEQGNRFDENTMDEALAFMEDLARKTQGLRDTLFGDLALMLTEEQSARIPVARLRLHRMSITSSEINNAFASGVSLGEDPITLAVRYDLPGSLSNEQAIAFNRALDAYDRGLDEVISDLEEHIGETLKGVTAFQEDPMGTMEEFEKVLGRLFKTTQEFRSIHQDRWLAIARTLPEKTGERWTNDFLRSLYPGPYERTKLETLIDRLLDDTTLSAEHFDALLMIADDHRDRVRKLRDEWCRELDDELRDMEFTLMALSMYDPFAVSRPFRERMQEIDAQTLERLRTRVDRALVDRLHQHLIDADRKDEPETFENEMPDG